MRIEKPEPFIGGKINMVAIEVINDHFDQWFDQHVSPINRLLEAGIEVYTNSYEGRANEWLGKAWVDDPTHKALLINIEPIKQETADDVLRDWLEYSSSRTIRHEEKDIRERAKAALSKETP